MPNPEEVALDVAALHDAPLLENLLELYLHDLSEAFPTIELGPDGRFGYDKLPLYWSEPEHRFPFLIRVGSRAVGFVLVRRGSTASDDPDVFDVAEFFVIRRYRRSGVGRRAAFLVWDRLPGRWIVRVYEANTGALRFWAGIIAEYTRGAATEVTRSVWRVFSFDSRRTDPSESYVVAIVLDPLYGEGIRALAERRDVWVVPSAENRRVVESLWANRQGAERNTQLTMWSKPRDLESEGQWLAMLEAIELQHHGEYSHDPPVTSLEIIGAEASSVARKALREYEYDVIETTPTGFVATKSGAV